VVKLEAATVTEMTPPNHLACQGNWFKSTRMSFILLHPFLLCISAVFIRE